MLINFSISLRKYHSVIEIGTYDFHTFKSLSSNRLRNHLDIGLFDSHGDNGVDPRATCHASDSSFYFTEPAPLSYDLLNTNNC